MREAARIAAVVGAALVAGAGLLFLITQVLAPAATPLRAGGVAVASPTPPPTAAPLPTLPPAVVVPPPPTIASANADRYLQDLTTAPGTLPGAIAGLDYRFEHGFGMGLSTTTRQEFVVPSGYRSMSASLKGLNATIRFTITDGGRTILDRTLSPFQPPVTVTCAAPDGSTVVLSALFEGGGDLSGAVAVWGDARFSTSPAPSGGCS